MCVQMAIKLVVIISKTKKLQQILWLILDAWSIDRIERKKPFRKQNVNVDWILDIRYSQRLCVKCVSKRSIEWAIETCNVNTAAMTTTGILTNVPIVRMNAVSQQQKMCVWEREREREHALCHSFVHSFIIWFGLKVDSVRPIFFPLLNDRCERVHSCISVKVAIKYWEMTWANGRARPRSFINW